MTQSRRKPVLAEVPVVIDVGPVQAEDLAKKAPVTASNPIITS